MLAALVRSMRPHQWVKNSFVFAPIVFAQRLGDPASLIREVSAVGAFIALSSAIYLLNDIVDVEKDRAHPVKRSRPIASGQVPVGVARGVAGGLAVCALGAALLLTPKLAATLAAYGALNVAYSFALKKVPVVDVAIIALGFLLRVIAGAVAIDVEMSPWLLVCTFCVALFLGLGKRKHELLGAGHGAAAQRDALRHYSHRPLDVALIATGVVTSVAYAAYTLAPHTQAMFQSPHLPWTIPFIVAGVARFGILVYREDGGVSPTERMVRDVPFVLNVVAWGALVISLIYL